MDGGAGNDTYSGSVGHDDTYFFSPGSDTINDAGGTDSLAFHAGINFEDLSFSVASSVNLVITQAGTGDNITIQAATRHRHLCRLPRRKSGHG